MNPTKPRIRAIIFDWAGTMIDYGSRAPAAVFQEIFRRQGINITIGQAREPMGMAKREHIKTIAEMENIAQQWRAKFGSGPADEDIDSLYQEFLPLQKQTLLDYGDLIPGAADVAQWCRDHDIKIGSSTGYTQELMQVVLPAAERQGYAPDVTLCADDAPAGRPAPWLIFEAAKRLDVYPMRQIVKVDDTVVGIQAGGNAGTWTVAVTKTGNELGCSEAEIEAMDPGELQTRIDRASKKFLAEGADFVIESVAELPPIIDQINERLST